MLQRKALRTGKSGAPDEKTTHQARFWWDYFWLAPWKAFLYLIWVPSTIFGRIMIQSPNVAAWIRPWIEFIQLALACSYFLFGVLYILTCVAYDLQYFGAMHIAFMCTMVPLGLVMTFTEFGTQIQRDPLDMRHHILTWNSSIITSVTDAGEVYGTLFITTTLIVFIQIYDLVMNGIQRNFETLNEFLVYRFCGTTIGIMCLVVTSSLFTHDTFRNRDNPAVQVLKPHAPLKVEQG